MRKVHAPLLILAFFFHMLVFGAAPAHAGKISDDLKTTIDKVLDIVKDEKYKDDKKARREMMRKHIDARFNYEQMSMRSLAENWKERTPDEQKEFVQLFGKLLENSYASKIESYHDEKITYISEDVRGDYAMVKTEIIRKDGTVNVDYKLILSDGVWKVYDFIIEGVSMVQNYRSQFSKIIKKESFNALKQKMNGKIDDLES